MNTDDAQLHPNWCALSTVIFPLKRFVSGVELQSQEESPNKNNTCLQEGINGAEAQKFYEELTKNSVTNTPGALVTNYSPAVKKREPPLLSFDCNKFFLFATTNNIEGLARFNYKTNDVNVCDDFGWTALMMAACEGAKDVVRMLLELGANKNIKERGGRTALDFAKQKGHKDIQFMLQTDINGESKSSDLKHKSSVVSSYAPYYCSVCDVTVSGANRLPHETSTLHLFNNKVKSFKNKLHKFNIPPKNRGLQLMVKQGWDKESGLGPTQTGRLYPIKTVIRKKRTGLGTDQEPARVTHFGAYDSQAIKHNLSSVLNKNKKRSRNDIRSEKIREQKRERRLRKELS